MALPKLEIKNIEHYYGEKKVLEVQKLSVEKGECVVIFGPNGSGKSTLLRVMSLIEKPTKGMIFYEGKEVSNKNSLEIRRRFALLLQNPVFFQGTVVKNIIYGLNVRKVPSHEIKEKLKKVTSLFSLDSLLPRRVEELSGGEAQRVNLARAFILEPEILFLDEPFSALDAPTREEVISELKRVIKKTGQTTVFVTHHREEAAFLGERVVILLEGKVYQQGPVEEVFSKPVCDEVARLVGVETVLKGKVAQNNGGLLKISVADQSFFVPGEAKLGEEVLVCVKPEEVIISKNKPESSVRNWFRGKIVEVSSYGRILNLGVDCGFLLRALVTQSSYRELNLKEGDEVWAGVKATSIHLIRREG
jgi:tungstate transport system ATP-binding protein